MLLGNYGLKGDSGIAVTTSSIVEKEMNSFHSAHCPTAFQGRSKSTDHAMWKTQKVICVQ